MRSVGFGIMGHHGYIAENYIAFGSEEDLGFSGCVLQYG